jgi:anti-sigma regulatory factor (Ser/Thr protein kinase)
LGRAGVSGWRPASAGAPEDECLLAQFAVPSAPGNERVALEQVADAVRDQGLGPDQLERLKTAVAEATMNAIEHGNANRAELPVDISVFRLTDADPPRARTLSR